MPAATSKKGKRQDQILTALNRNPTKRVIQLAEELNVTPETIRRDLKELESLGSLNRTYGGALKSQVSEPALAERLSVKVKERQAIADKAMSLIDNASSIFIGGGATTIHFAKALLSISRPLTVITHSYIVATELSSNQQIEILSLPGIFDGKESLVHGPETLKAIEHFRPPVAILGASGFDEEGISDAMVSASQVYGAMIKNAEQAYILVDQTKHNIRALSLISKWHEKIHVITDAEPKDKVKDAMIKANVKISIV